MEFYPVAQVLVSVVAVAVVVALCGVSLMALGLVWLSSLELAKLSTPDLSRSHIQLMNETGCDVSRTLNHFLSVYAANMGLRTVSGSLSSSNAAHLISIYSHQHGLAKIGSPMHGQKSSVLASLDELPEQESKQFGADVTEWHHMQGNMHKNKSKKPCRICSKIRELAGGGAS